jgi:gluconolactonase
MKIASACRVALLATLVVVPTIADDAARPRIHRLDPRIDALIPADAEVETLAAGFRWVEGPVWDPAGEALYFSDIPANAVIRWDPAGGTEVFLSNSGYSGKQPFRGREPGSNGLTLDAEGRLVLCEHGNRRITRLEKDGSRTVLVDRYRGKRLNSPNDAVYDKAGNLYFTDPPFGLPGTFDDPARELGFSGVYRLDKTGNLDLLTGALMVPNGIALSPDEKVLYLTDVNPERPAWLAFELRSDGTLGKQSLLRNASAWTRERPGGPDGIEVDLRGNLFGAGPGGVYVFATDGTVLGWIELGTPAGNVAWGEDGSSLFIAADKSIYRVRTTTRGPIR